MYSKRQQRDKGMTIQKEKKGGKKKDPFPMQRKAKTWVPALKGGYRAEVGRCKQGARAFRQKVVRVMSAV